EVPGWNKECRARAGPEEVRECPAPLDNTLSRGRGGLPPPEDSQGSRASGRSRTCPVAVAECPEFPDSTAPPRDSRLASRRRSRDSPRYRRAPAENRRGGHPSRLAHNRVAP